MKKVIFATVVLLVFSANVSMAGVAGEFQWPFSLFSDYRKDQYYMEFYIDIGKYHMGEDWNAIDGVDLSDPLYAIADGYVVYVDKVGVTPGKGKRVIVRYTLPNGTQIDSEYLHCDSILVNWSGPGTGDTVVKGQKIATIGNTGTTSSHLHWHIQTDLTIPLGENPYQNPLTPIYARKYTSPSLFVNDRANKQTTLLSSGTWTYFNIPNYAPSSTAHIEYQSQKYSLQGAVNAGLIYQYVYVNIGGVWYYYPDINNVFFEPGNTYAIYSFVASSAMNVLIPGYNYSEDRARSDMIKIAAEDARFNEVWVKSEYPIFNSEDVSYIYRQLPFHFQKSDGITGAAYFYHATSKTNLLVRYVYKYIIDTAE